MQANIDRELREEQDQAYQRTLVREQEEKAQKQQQEQEEAQEREKAEAQQAEHAEAEEAEHKIRARLISEPPADSVEPATELAFRLPDNSRLVRRFLQSQPLSDVIDFLTVDERVRAAVPHRRWTLSSSYPRRVLNPAPAPDGHGSSTLSDLDLCPTAALIITDLDR
jgi:hypothetical protein